MCSSDEEKIASSEKYSVVEYVESERAGINSSATACCPKTGSDIAHTVSHSPLKFVFVCLIKSQSQHVLCSAQRSSVTHLSLKCARLCSIHCYYQMRLQNLIEIFFFMTSSALIVMSHHIHHFCYIAIQMHLAPMPVHLFSLCCVNNCRPFHFGYG